MLRRVVIHAALNWKQEGLLTNYFAKKRAMIAYLLCQADTQRSMMPRGGIGLSAREFSETMLHIRQVIQRLKN